MRFLRECQRSGYKINLFYVWLNSPELAVARVARRVASGGHNIPRDTIIRRYERGRKNFFELYSPIADRWIAYDNSQQRQKIAEKPLNQLVTIYQPQRKATNSYQLIMNNSIPDKLSTICDSLFQKAIDEAIEQHRIKEDTWFEVPSNP